MQFQFDMTSLQFPSLAGPAASGEEMPLLLAQMLEVQREQLAHLRALAAAQDAGSRWRAFVARWREDFPELPIACREALPILERTYSKLIAELVDALRLEGNEALESEFTLQDFLDRYGMRLSQLGTILNMVAPLAEVGPASS